MEKDDVRRKNLIGKGFNELPPEKAREIQVKGGQASGMAKRRKKTFLEIMEWLGEKKATKQELANFKNIFPDATDEEITKDIMVAAAQYHKAISKADTFAAAFIRDTKGEKPDTKVNGSIVTEKIFITPEEKEATIDHIKKVIADGNDGNK